jgi:toxin FitB
VNVVDSSGWLEYLADGPNADFFAPAIERTRDLLVPTVTLTEVFKRVAQQRGTDEALSVVALMHQGQVVDFDASLALDAARLGLQHQLPLADSMIYATAQRHDATLWSQDADFDGLPSVRYRSAVPPPRPTP